jgi:hypothetical protein
MVVSSVVDGARRMARAHDTDEWVRPVSTCQDILREVLQHAA